MKKVFLTMSAVLLGLGLILPLALLFMRILPHDLAGFLNLITPATKKAILNSLYLSTGAALLGTCGGFLFSWILWRFSFSQTLTRNLLTVLKIPYLLPPFLFAMGWLALAAPRAGFLNQALQHWGLSFQLSIYGLQGAVFVLSLWNVALAMIQLQPFFDHFPGHLEDAALLCGAGPWHVFWKITLPLARTQILACFFLTFTSALAAFGVPGMLALPARQQVITTRIYQSIKSGTSLDAAVEAGLLSLLLFVVALLALAAQYFIERRKPRFATLTGKAQRPSQLRPRRREYFIFVVILLFALTAVMLPCFGVATQSFLRDRSDITSWSWDRYRYVFMTLPNALQSVGNSFLTATLGSIAALVIALAFSVIERERKKSLEKSASICLNTLWNLGYALPGTTLALALLVFFNGTLTDTVWILALAYLIKYCAFSLRTIAPALNTLSREFEEAAWMSGARPAQTFFHITLKLLRPALVAALILSFLPMFSELTMSVLLSGAGTETIGVLIYRFQEYADPGSAAVLGVLLLTVTLVFNSLVKSLTKGKFGL